MFDTTAPAVAELSPDIDLLLTSGGGHVGFVSGTSPFRPVYWCEDQTVAFIAGN
jgi:hypothetical protein